MNDEECEDGVDNEFMKEFDKKVKIDSEKINFYINNNLLYSDTNYLLKMFDIKRYPEYQQTLLNNIFNHLKKYEDLDKIVYFVLLESIDKLKYKIINKDKLIITKYINIKNINYNIKINEEEIYYYEDPIVFLSLYYINNPKFIKHPLIKKNLKNILITKYYQYKNGFKINKDTEYILNHLLEDFIKLIV